MGQRGVGLMADRPAVGDTPSQRYFAIDQEIDYIWTGSVWMPATNYLFYRRADAAYHEGLLSGSDHVGLGLSADILYATPFLVSQRRTIDSIQIYVTGAGAGGTQARLGIYASDSNLYPSDLILDAGLVSVATTGAKTIAISQVVSPQLLWMGVVTDGTPTIIAIGSNSYWSLLGIAVSTFYTHWQVAHVFGALPDPFTGGGTKTAAPYPMLQASFA